MTDALALIDAEIALLTRVVDAPDGNALGYGTDLSCVSDCTASFDELDPFTPLGIAQSCIRRLTCPRGGCPDEHDYGLYLPGYVNRGVEQSELRELNGDIVGELRKDDRIADLTVKLSYDATLSKVLQCSILITPEDPALNSFTFTISVTDADVLLETIDA